MFIKCSNVDQSFPRLKNPVLKFCYNVASQHPGFFTSLWDFLWKNAEKEAF